MRPSQSVFYPGDIQNSQERSLRQFENKGYGLVRGVADKAININKLSSEKKPDGHKRVFLDTDGSIKDDSLE